MKKVTIIYGSTTGNTETAANMVKDNLSDAEVVISDVKDATAQMVEDADLVVYGSSTWGYGDLQDDFQEYYDKEMSNDLLSGKNVAIFGCGDEESFEDVFCEATEQIKSKVEECGGNVVNDILKINGEPSDNESEIAAFAKSL